MGYPSTQGKDRAGKFLTKLTSFCRPLPLPLPGRRGGRPPRIFSLLHDDIHNSLRRHVSFFCCQIVPECERLFFTWTHGGRSFCVSQDHSIVHANRFPSRRCLAAAPRGVPEDGSSLVMTRPTDDGVALPRCLWHCADDDTREYPPGGSSFSLPSSLPSPLASHAELRSLAKNLRGTRSR